VQFAIEKLALRLIETAIGQNSICNDLGCISGLASTPVNGDQPIVKFADSRDIWVSDSAAPLDAKIFAQVTGADSSHILISGCDLRTVGKAVEAIGDAPKNAATATGNILAAKDGWDR
jgi:hypothetical protein